MSFATRSLSHSSIFVILNFFQDNTLPPPAMLKQVQHDELLGSEVAA